MNGQNTPMSDERLEGLREYGALVSDYAINDLIAEVDRLKSEHREAVMLTLTYQTQTEEAHERADRAEAALARVTDDSMAERIHDALADNGADILPSDARVVLDAIRAVATEEHTDA